MDGRPEIRSEVVSILQSGRISWEELVWEASRHFVLPALYVSLKRHGLLSMLPADLVAHLGNIFQLNTERTSSILLQAGEIARELSAAGIRPVFLKGTGYLLQNLFADPAERIMVDIDLMVSREQGNEALRILQKMGYRSEAGGPDPGTDDHHHYPMLSKPGMVAGVELHRQATHAEYLRYLPADHILQEAQPVLDGMAAVPRLQHQVLLHFLHDQLVHRQFVNRDQLLRSLYDFYLLTSRAGWGEALPLKRALRWRFEAYRLLCGQVFGTLRAHPVKYHWYARYYLFTWELMHHPSRVSALLHRVVLRFNRLCYLAGFVVQAVWRPDRRRMVVRRLRRLFGRNPEVGNR